VYLPADLQEFEPASRPTTIYQSNTDQESPRNPAM